MDIDNVIQDIQNHLDTLDNSIKRYNTADSSSKGSLVQRMQTEIQTLEQKIPQVKKMIQSVGGDEAEVYEEDVKSIISDFETFKAQYSKINQEYNSNREYAQKNVQQSEALRKFKEAKDDAHEINQVLNQDLLTLDEDRQILSNIDSNVNDIGNEADKGLTRGKRMLRRACFHKMIGWIIVLILAALLAVILYLRFSKGKILYCKHHKNTESCK